jgi:hypothetical protein
VVIDSRMIEHRTVRQGDFNRDGRIDLLAASVGFSSTQAAAESEPAVHGASVVWFENPARPREQPWPKHVIDDRSRGPIQGHPIDLDRDGDLDVLMAFGMRPEHILQDQHAIAWYENRGGAQDSTAWRRHVLANLPSAFETFAAAPT